MSAEIKIYGKSNIFHAISDSTTAEHVLLFSLCLLLSIAIVPAQIREEEHKCKGEGHCSSASNQQTFNDVVDKKETPSKDNVRHKPEPARRRKHSSWGSAFDNVDRPVQLVYPDEKSHKKLILHEENLKLLQYIQEPLAIVGVVGKFHTGKSFLLNQLMGKKVGFGVGPFVRPETMGIWMWGKPIRMTLNDGQQVALVFLDTEGFAATNISETYDAKVFAVSTLLSSFLIYNSVKIIDQGDIDYLELLSRRTQLFALKSQMSKAKWTDEFNHDLLMFPPLIWVVQDFVQMTEDDDDEPSKWLNRLLSSSSKDSEEHTVSLKAIFPSVDCHTLFLPATKKHLLQDLSRAREEDLTEEYKLERDHLIQKIKTGLKPKGKNGSPITGPELASLLEILVEAANEGSLAQIPSRWNIFIEKLERTAKEDCLEFYEGEMELLHKKYDDGPIPEGELQDWHNVAHAKSKKLLSHLLFGLGHVVDESSRGLSRKVDEHHEKTLDMNAKKTTLKFNDAQRRLELESEEELEKVVLPVKSSHLMIVFATVQNHTLAKFGSTLEYLSNSSAFETYYSRLQESLRSLQDSYALKNSKALEGVLKYAMDRAIGVFLQTSSSKDNTPRAPKVLVKVIDNANQEAIELFKAESEIAAEEDIFQPYLFMLQGKIDEGSLSVQQDNTELVRLQANSKEKELLMLFRDNTASHKIALPINDTDLDSRLATEKERIFSTYTSSQTGFEEFEVVKLAYQSLKVGLEAIGEERHHENMVAYSREVKIPLTTSKKVVLISADNYDTEFSLKQYIRQVCLLNLDEGKPKHWPISLKNTIIDNFITTDKDVLRVVKSRQGLWKNIKGFFQWLLWLFGMY